MVIITHLVLRPVARSINRQTIQDAGNERLYILRIVCRSDDEQHIRTLFVQAIVKESLLLQAMESEDLEGTDKVEVKTFILANGRQDTLMGKVVGLLSLEQAVSAASWRQFSPSLEECRRAGKRRESRSLICGTPKVEKATQHRICLYQDQDRRGHEGMRFDQ
ncbi:MAG: hypothetical protein ACLPX5_05955 [Dissulfurispiraceae bacterium]